MPPTKQQKRKNAIIQKEQTQLLKIQTELEGLMSKVGEALNILKVEELQLKSSAFMYENSQIKKETPQKELSEHQILPVISDSQPSQVNQQLVNLDISNFRFGGGDIEEDDDI